MKLYQQYEEYINQEPYVTQGSILACTYGTKLSSLDTSATANICDKGTGQPILQCDDCKVGENIYSFYSCRAPEYSSLPMRTIMDDGYKKCIPLLGSEWSQSGDNAPYIWDCVSGDCSMALKKSSGIVCIYLGYIGILEVPEKEVEQLVTLAHLDAFNFYVGANDSERTSGINTLNDVLKKYDIKTDKAIAFFMGQVAKESRKGARTLEGYEGNSPEEYFNNKYDYEHAQRVGTGNTGGNDGEHFRGAGYIQLTGRANYEDFSSKVGDSRIVTEGYRIVGGVYNKDPNTIKYDEVGAIDIGEYAWEAAGWFWKYGNPKRTDLSTYAEDGEWLFISESINKNDSATFPERNKYINEFYKILTGNALNLPE